VIGELLLVRSGVLQRRGKLDEALSVALGALAIAEKHEPDSESTGQLEGNVAERGPCRARRDGFGVRPGL
jgi:hypothetical protein